MNLSSVFYFVFEISIISSIIGLIIILLRHLLKKRVNSKWIYFIWFILLFKLLVPINIESVVSIFNFMPEYVSDNNYIENSKIEYENVQKQYNNYISDNTKEQKEVITTNINDNEFQEIEQKYNSYKFKNIIFEYILPSIWFLGFFVMLLWLIITNLILNFKLRNKISDNSRLDDIFKSCKEKMNIKTNIDVIVNNVISTPALIGVFKVKILIPYEILKISDENLRYILLHELSHYKRKDMWLNYILLVIQSIHWFNPIIWLCFNLLRNDLEVATDEYTLKYIDKGKYKSYANALIETLNVTKNLKFSPRLVGMIDNKENIKRRIIMIKSLEIFNKRKVIITIICVLLIVGCSLFLLTSPISSNKPNDNLYIFSISEENKIHRGAYKWKYAFGEVIADGIEPLEYAKSIEKFKCNVSEKISILSNTSFEDINQIELLELENNINLLTVDNVTDNKIIEFVVPNTVGTYYYLVKVRYINESYVEYVFSIDVVQDDNIVKDTSKKIAKLLTDIVWDFDALKYNGNVVREISENQLDCIDRIYDNADTILGTISFSKNADYAIDFYDGTRKSIEFRITNDATIIMQDNSKNSKLKTVYKEDDVIYLLNLLGQKNKYASLPIINLEEYKAPIDIYWYGGTKFEIGSYSWKTSISDEFSNITSSDAVLPLELLKDKNFVEWTGILGSCITIYSRKDGAIKKLPEQTMVKYKIYGINENGYNTDYNIATRMIDGSYYLVDLPKVRGEYIVEVFFSFDELSSNSAHYYIKLKS